MAENSTYVKITIECPIKVTLEGNQEFSTLALIEVQRRLYEFLQASLPVFQKEPSSN